MTARYAFTDDYSEGACPAVLDALARANNGQQPAYGADELSQQASRLIRAQTNTPDAAVHLVPSGTVANIIGIAASLRPHEAVIAVNSGHIAGREAGAIEATGHKIILVPGDSGRVTPDDVTRALAANSHYPHMARPRLVYLSNATELGTVYSLAQLQALSDVCRENNLMMMLDGARVAVALAGSSPVQEPVIAARQSLPTLQDIAALTDLFWIGGTKNGALFGEAIVVTNPALREDVSFQVKQRGAMLAKGRVLGAQFCALFDDDTYATLARHANTMAARLSRAVQQAGYALAADTESNQVFPVLPNAVVDALASGFDFHPWEAREDGTTVIRLVTSWATDPQRVDALADAIGQAG